MFMNLDQSLVRQHIQELVHEAQWWHLQRNLRANREQSLGTRPQVDSSPTATGVIEEKQQRGALIVLKRQERESGVEHEGSSTESLGASEELVRRYVALRRRQR